MNVNRYGSTDQTSYPRALMPPPDVAAGLTQTTPRIYSPAGALRVPSGNAADWLPRGAPDGRTPAMDGGGQPLERGGDKAAPGRPDDLGKRVRDSHDGNGNPVRDTWGTDGRHTRDNLSTDGTRIRDTWDTDGKHIRDSLSTDGTRIRDTWDTDGKHIRDSVDTDGTRIRDTWDTDGKHTRDSVNAAGEHIHDSWDADGEHIHERLNESGKHVRDTWNLSGDHIRDTWDEEGNHIRDVWDANGKHKRIFWREKADNTPPPVDVDGLMPGPARRHEDPVPQPMAGDAAAPTPRPGDGAEAGDVGSGSAGGDADAGNVGRGPSEPAGNSNEGGPRLAGPAGGDGSRPFAPTGGGRGGGGGGAPGGSPPAAPDGGSSAPPFSPADNAPAPRSPVRGDLQAPDTNTGYTDYGQPAPGAALPPALIGLTPEQGGIVTRAYQHVKRMIDSALDTLESGHPDANFSHWFGNPTPRNVQKVEQVLTHMQHAMSHDRFTFVLGAPHDNRELAHVQASSPHQINLKPLFFDHAFGANTPEATIAHELSHFPYIGNTKDHLYGPGAVANLAARNSDIATDNAENYGMFVRAQATA